MTLVSTSIMRNYHLSYDYLISELAAFGYEDEEEIENVASKIINEVERNLPDCLNWQPDFSELWMWGESVTELLEKEVDFTEEDFDRILNEAWGKVVY